MPRVILYTCGAKKSGGGLPGPLAHPCGRAASALDDAGHVYELRTVEGYKMLPWTRSGGKRAEIRELTGQEDVPVLVLDDGTAVHGSGTIARWAREHPAG
jgi:glutathione S-transferase